MLLAQQMGKTRIIAETGAGQHGVATATACALFGLPCEVYMGDEDVKRQAPNVGRMRLLGAEVIPVESGSRTLKDAMNEALRDWVTNVRTTHYCIGSAAGPHPYPSSSRLPARHRRGGARAVPGADGRLPDAAIACVGGGSNAIGLFRAFLADDGVRSSASRRRATASAGRHAATLGGAVGVLHGSESYVLHDDDGQITRRTRSAPASTTPASGPSTRGSRRPGARGTCRRRTTRRWAVQLVARTEGIIPALETAHAFARVGAWRRELAARGRPCVVVGLSGRGDKDLATASEWFGV